MSFFKTLFSGKPSKANEPAQPAATQTREGVRERYFNKEYYDQMMEEAVAFDRETERQYKQLIAERGPDYDGYKIIEFQLADGLINRLTIAYSRGDSIQSLIPMLEKATYHFIRSWDNDDFIYNHILRIVSLAKLLDSSNDKARQLANLLERENFNDALINYLIYQNKRVQTLMFSEDRGLVALLNITELSAEQAAQNTKIYLEKYWYTRDRLDTLFNSHKDLKGGHFGYWSFEAADITKIMGLDDSSYRDNEYYPYDLVHWQDK